MATKVVFAGAERTLPGAYSTIVSGENNAPLNLPYGKLLIIDTGLGAGWGGGSGINGALATGQDSVYHFTSIDDCRNFLKGGLMWFAMQQLFYPFRFLNGVSDVYFVKAATTVAPTLTFTTSATGTFKLDCIDEGVGGNGILTETHLDKGFAYTMEAGVNDTSKFIMKIWRGAWVGDHTDGFSYNEITKANSEEILLVQSPELVNIQELIDWANSSSTLGKYCKLNATSAVIGTGVIADIDVSGLSGYQLAAGGTETYSTDDLDDVFEAINELDYQFILSTDYGTEGYDNSFSTKVFTHIQDPETQFMKFMVIGGGEDEDELSAADGSIPMAEYFDSELVRIVHGGMKTSSQLTASKFREWPSFIHAATVVGRICGLAPQIPATNKKINVAALKHTPTIKERNLALGAGVIVTIPNQYEPGTFKILQDVNTLQDNEILFTSAGKSFSGQFMRIVAQINRELIINSELDLMSDETGVNANTLSAGILKTWTETYLGSRIATTDQDNLLLNFRNVTVEKVDDYYKVNYGIVVNNEITKIFFTGFLFKQ